MKKSSNSPEFMTKVRNDLFDAKLGLDRGRSKLCEAAWYLLKCGLFLTPLPFPSAIKRFVLRCFGAQVGCGVVIKPRVNIHFPWKLSIGDHTWIGEEVSILNFEPVSIGKHCCISQRAFLCGGNHNYREPDMRYRNGPITVKDGVWIGAQSFVAADVVIGTEAVILAGSIVSRSQPSQMVCSGNPCVPVRPRWQEFEGTDQQKIGRWSVQNDEDLWLVPHLPEYSNHSELEEVVVVQSENTSAFEEVAD
jgi:putative colanic acid biosynthesis acetyltransferase WcaF